jgi:hypothetical protein
VYLWGCGRAEARIGSTGKEATAMQVKADATVKLYYSRTSCDYLISEKQDLDRTG